MEATSPRHASINKDLQHLMQLEYHFVPQLSAFVQDLTESWPRIYMQFGLSQTENDRLTKMFDAFRLLHIFHSEAFDKMRKKQSDHNSVWNFYHMFGRRYASYFNTIFSHLSHLSIIMQTHLKLRKYCAKIIIELIITAFEHCFDQIACFRNLSLNMPSKHQHQTPCKDFFRGIDSLLSKYTRDPKYQDLLRQRMHLLAFEFSVHNLPRPLYNDERQHISEDNAYVDIVKKKKNKKFPNFGQSKALLKKKECVLHLFSDMTLLVDRNTHEFENAFAFENHRFRYNPNNTHSYFIVTGHEIGDVKIYFDNPEICANAYQSVSEEQAKFRNRRRSHSNVAQLRNRSNRSNEFSSEDITINTDIVYPSTDDTPSFMFNGNTYSAGGRLSPKKQLRNRAASNVVTINTRSQRQRPFVNHQRNSGHTPNPNHNHSYNNHSYLHGGGSGGQHKYNNDNDNDNNHNNHNNARANRNHNSNHNLKNTNDDKYHSTNADNRQQNSSATIQENYASGVQSQTYPRRHTHHGSNHANTNTNHNKNNRKKHSKKKQPQPRMRVQRASLTANSTSLSNLSDRFSFVSMTNDLSSKVSDPVLNGAATAITTITAAATTINTGAPPITLITTATPLTPYNQSSNHNSGTTPVVNNTSGTYITPPSSFPPNALKKNTKCETPASFAGLRRNSISSFYFKTKSAENRSRNNTEPTTKQQEQQQPQPQEAQAQERQQQRLLSRASPLVEHERQRSLSIGQLYDTALPKKVTFMAMRHNTTEDNIANTLHYSDRPRHSHPHPHPRALDGNRDSTNEAGADNESENGIPFYEDEDMIITKEPISAFDPMGSGMDDDDDDRLNLRLLEIIDSANGSGSGSGSGSESATENKIDADDDDEDDDDNEPETGDADADAIADVDVDADAKEDDADDADDETDETVSVANSAAQVAFRRKLLNSSSGDIPDYYVDNSDEKYFAYPQAWYYSQMENAEHYRTLDVEATDAFLATALSAERFREWTRRPKHPWQLFWRDQNDYGSSDDMRSMNPYLADQRQRRLSQTTEMNVRSEAGSDPYSESDAVGVGGYSDEDDSENDSNTNGGGRHRGRRNSFLSDFSMGASSALRQSLLILDNDDNDDKNNNSNVNANGIITEPTALHLRCFALRKQNGFLIAETMRTKDAMQKLQVTVDAKDHQIEELQAQMSAFKETLKQNQLKETQLRFENSKKENQVVRLQKQIKSLQSSASEAKRGRLPAAAPLMNRSQSFHTSSSSSNSNSNSSPFIQSVKVYHNRKYSGHGHGHENGGGGGGGGGGSGFHSGGGGNGGKNYNDLSGYHNGQHMNRRSTISFSLKMNNRVSNTNNNNKKKKNKLSVVSLVPSRTQFTPSATPDGTPNATPYSSATDGHPTHEEFPPTLTLNESDLSATNHKMSGRMKGTPTPLKKANVSRFQYSSVANITKRNSFMAGDLLQNSPQTPRKKKTRNFLRAGAEEDDDDDDDDDEAADEFENSSASSEEMTSALVTTSERCKTIDENSTATGGRHSSRDNQKAGKRRMLKLMESRSAQFLEHEEPRPVSKAKQALPARQYLTAQQKSHSRPSKNKQVRSRARFNNSNHQNSKHNHSHSKNNNSNFDHDNNGQEENGHHYHPPGKPKVRSGSMALLRNKSAKLKKRTSSNLEYLRDYHSVPSNATKAKAEAQERQKQQRQQQRLQQQQQQQQQQARIPRSKSKMKAKAKPSSRAAKSKNKQKAEKRVSSMGMATASRGYYSKRHSMVEHVSDAKKLLKLKQRTLSPSLAPSHPKKVSFRKV